MDSLRPGVCVKWGKERVGFRSQGPRPRPSSTCGCMGTHQEWVTGSRSGVGVGVAVTGLEACFLALRVGEREQDWCGGGCPSHWP